MEQINRSEYYDAEELEALVESVAGDMPASKYVVFCTSPVQAPPSPRIINGVNLWYRPPVDRHLDLLRKYRERLAQAAVV